MSCCVTFITYAERWHQILRTYEDQMAPGVLGVPKPGPDASTTASLENTSRSLSRLEDMFLQHMKLLIDELNLCSATETVQFLCLVVRLDYNLFYDAAIAKDRGRRQQRKKGE